MPDDILTEPLSEAESSSPTALRDALRKHEKTQHGEVIGCGMLASSTDPKNMVNVFDTKDNLQSSKLALIEVDPVPNDADRDQNLSNLLTSRTAIEYAEIALAGMPTWLLISRPGIVLTYKGKMSTFGGPDDTGMREDEPLAIVRKDNFAAYVAKHSSLFGTNLFLANPTDAKGTPLGRKLNPDAFYLACRWDYKNEIAREDLIDCTIAVRNVLTDAESEAIATDWGPNIRTNRVADLSPGLAKHLGLRTDDECLVTVSGSKIKGRVAMAATTGPTPTAAPANLVVFDQGQLEQRFGKITPIQENGDGSFKILNQNFNSNIVDADISPLKGIRGVPSSGRVECHTAIRAALEAAVQDIVAAGKRDLILTWDGLWVPRHILWDMHRNFSTHSWAVAFDINVAWNGYGSAPARAGSRGSVEELVPLFANRGFYWGGYFRTPDGMHFQFGQKI